MSVINQMLRDLDARQRAGQSSVVTDPDVRNITRGTMSVASNLAAENRASLLRRAPLVLALVVAVALALTGGWILKNRLGAPSIATVQNSTPGVTRPGGAAGDTVAGVPTKNPSAQALLSHTVATGHPTRTASTPSEAKTVVADATTTESLRHAAIGSKPTFVAGEISSNQPSSFNLDKPSGMRGATVPAVAATHAATSAPTLRSRQEMTPEVNQTRAQATMDIIAQAQALEGQGAGEAATQLLREAVAVLERSAAGGNSAELLLPSVRELTRMELAQGRAAAALDLLVRLEPLLANQPDVWALRGNAAQRLGRHTESAHAYLTALKLRPGETRWMLGAAVSLAADGHTAQAAELAEKAQERGALSVEVAAYLRQQGVALRQP